MNQLLNKIHRKLLLEIIRKKIDENPDGWIISQKRYYSDFIYDDDECYIRIIYSIIYNRIEFLNKNKNKIIIHSAKWFERRKLGNDLKGLIEERKLEDLEDILNFNENQESENGEKE